MKDNFDVHEWNIRNIREANGLEGYEASKKVIEFLRSKIYPKLSDDEMDKFVVEMCGHFDCEPPAYRLNEEVGPKQKVLSIKDLTFDLVKSMFPNIGTGYGTSVAFPNPNDSSRSVSSESDLESWKAETMDRYGNINLKIDTEAANWWDKVQVLDDKFRDDKDSYIAGKAAT